MWKVHSGTWAIWARLPWIGWCLTKRKLCRTSTVSPIAPNLTIFWNWTSQNIPDQQHYVKHYKKLWNHSTLLCSLQDSLPASSWWGVCGECLGRVAAKIFVFVFSREFREIFSFVFREIFSFVFREIFLQFREIFAKLEIEICAKFSRNSKEISRNAKQEITLTSFF